MTNETYGRGQIEWALWRAFTPLGVSSGDAPRKFRTRIKRLLDIDRELDLSKAEVRPEIEYAFAEPDADAGVETAYTPCDVFCLGVALDLLDSGFKQSEVVFLMRYLRTDLEEFFPELLKPPSITDRQRHRAVDHPDFPSIKEGQREYADRRVFVVLKKVELTEIIPPKTKKSAAGPIILEPVFCHGVEALAEEIHDLMPNRRRAVTILELAATAQSSRAWLAKAPPIRRGRPKEKE